jgi:pimeloyl-ACP methyl ester carboxylesterase
MSLEYAVFIPSQLLTAPFWTPLVERLCGRIEATVIDGSSHDNVAAIAQSILDIAPKRFSLFSHGMGGFIAFEMWRRAPERIERLLLFGTLASQDAPAQTQRRLNYLRLVQSGQFDAVVEERLPLLVHPERRDDAVLLASIREMARTTGPEHFLKQQHAIMNRPDSRATLRQIDCPILIVYGRHDGITTLAHQQEMLEDNPRASFQIVEECGHLGPIERPDLIARLVTEWLWPGGPAEGGVTNLHVN